MDEVRGAIDFNHDLVGRAVVYRDPHKPKGEQGVITSVNTRAKIAFVRYGDSIHSQATGLQDGRLTFLSGKPVTLENPSARTGDRS